MVLQFTDISGDGNQPSDPDFIQARDLGGIDGSWVKSSGGGGPQGYPNPDRETQLAAVEAAGLPGGWYHLCNEPGRPRVGPIEEAKFAHDAMGARDVPICLDWEYDGWDQHDGLLFLERLEELRKRTPWVYLNEYFSARYGVTDAAYARFPLWIASWVKGNNPAPPDALPAPLYAWRMVGFKMWQFTSQATVPGIGAVDKNLYFGSADDFRNSGKAPRPAMLAPVVTERYDWGQGSKGRLIAQTVTVCNDDEGKYYEGKIAYEATGPRQLPWREV